MRYGIRLAALLFTLASVAGACSDDPAPSGFVPGEDGGAGTPDAGPGPGEPDANTGPVRPKFQRCTGMPFTPDPAGSWTNSGSAITVLAGSPGHSAQDI